MRQCSFLPQKNGNFLSASGESQSYIKGRSIERKPQQLTGEHVGLSTLDPNWAGLCAERYIEVERVGEAA